MTQFAQTLLPLLPTAPADIDTLLKEFAPLFRNAFQGGMQKKLGLPANTNGAEKFTDTTLVAMVESGIYFTVFFDRLTLVAAGEPDARVLELFGNQRKGAAWLEHWHALRSDRSEVLAAMRRANPVVIARNHRVEQAIDAAVDDENFEPFRRLCRVLANPFEIDPADQDLQTPPRPQ